LRIHGLGARGFWGDELDSLDFSAPSFLHIWIGPYWDYHPPLYYAILHIWIAIFGYSEVAVRLPSVLFGIVSVWLAWDVGRRLLGPAAGLAGAFGVALIPVHLLQGQDARMYTLLTAVALLSVRQMLSLLTRPSVGRLVGYVIATAALCYTQPVGPVYVLAENVGWLAFGLTCRGVHRRNLAWWIAAQSFVVVIYIPWAVVQFHFWGKLQGTFWVHDRSISTNLFLLIGMFAGGGTYKAAYVLAPLLTVAAAIGIAGGLRPATWRNTPEIARSTFLVLILAALPPVIFAVVSILSQPVFVSRLFLPSSIGAYWLAGAGTARLPARWAKVAFLVAGLFVASEGLQFGAGLRPAWLTTDYRAAFEALARQNPKVNAIYLQGWVSARQYLLRAARLAGTDPARLPPIITSRVPQLEEAMRDFCTPGARQTLLVVAVADEPMPYWHLVSGPEYRAILHHAGLAHAAWVPLDGRVVANLWQCEK